MSTRLHLKQLRDKRTRIVEESRSMYDRAQAEGRELTAEELGRHKERVAEAQQLLEQIEAAEAQLELEAEINEPGPRVSADPIASPDEESEEVAPIAYDEIPAGLRALIPEGYELVPRGRGAIAPGSRWSAVAARFFPYATVERDFLASREYNEAYDRYLGGRRLNAQHQELLFRADVHADNDSEGGFLRPPIQVVAELLQELDDEVFIRQWARTFTVRQAASLGVPYRKTRVNTFAWGGEVTQPTKDSSLAFGGRELHPHELTGEIDVSRKFLRSSILPGVQIVNRELARDAGEKEEDGFLVGTGAGQPLGLFTASAKGISTSRDFSTGNTTTTMKFDGLTRAYMGLKMRHRQNSRFLTSRTGIEQLMLEKDGEGRPLWQLSVREGEPDRVLSRPAFESERVPATFTAGLYVGMFADFSYYWIADALEMEIQRLVELEARSNLDAFIARLNTDGMPVLEEAFSRVKLSS